MHRIFPQLSACLASAAALLVACAPAMAQGKWPDKPIRFIVPYPAGGGTDIVARALGKQMAESLGQQVVVENRPGASTIIATEILARSPADGYTIGMVTDSHALNPSFVKKLPYDSKKDFALISQLVFVPFVVVANPKLNVSTMGELIAAAKANPGKINYASIGNGTPHYLAMEWLKALAKIDLTHVPYKGVAPALVDLVGGQVDVMFTGMSSGLPHIKTGRLKGLAVSSPQRSAQAPELPTVAESGVEGFTSFMTWYGLAAPAGTPVAVVARLNAEVRKALESKELKEQFTQLGVEPAPSTPDEFARFMEAESANYARIIEMSGAKGE